VNKKESFNLQIKRLVWYPDEFKTKEKQQKHRYAVEAHEKKKASALGGKSLSSKQDTPKWHLQWTILIKIVRTVKCIS
jgi:hypothetical protein